MTSKFETWRSTRSSKLGHATRGFLAARAEMDVALAGEVPDLFLLDVMLPDEDGISVLKTLAR